MKKRVFSILLCLCMVMTLLPTAALADSNTYGAFTVTGDDLSGVSYAGGILTVSSAAPITISQTGGATASTTDRIEVNSSSGASITLAGVNIDVSSQADTAAFKASTNTGTMNLTLAADSENILKSGSNNAGVEHIATNAATMLTIGGSGSLTATGGNGTSKNSYGINAAALTIGSSAKVTAVGSKADGEWASSVGLYANSKLVITGTAQVTATGGEAKYSYGVQTNSSGKDLGLRYVSGKLTASGGTQASEREVYQGLTGNTVAPATTGAYTDKSATWEPPEAQWGVANGGGVPLSWAGFGTLDDAVTYANDLIGGTAYIQIQSNVVTGATLLFYGTKTTILDLNGKTIDANDGNFSVLTVNGDLTLCDRSTSNAAAQGKITGGKGPDGFGGGVYINSTGTFTMTGGKITGNTTDRSGGGVVGIGAENDHVVMTMTGGSITGNHTRYNGGGVFIQTGIFTVGGTAKITGNTSGTAPDTLANNVYLLGSSFPPSQQILTISTATPFATGASIGVRTTYVPSALSPLDFTGTNSDDYSGYFTSDNSSYVVQNSGSDSTQVVQLAVPPIQAPTVTAVSPASGSTAGGTPVTITGTNLSGATAVKFGSTSATIMETSATSITATAPAGTGTVYITVTTAGGTSATSEAGKFTYTLPTAADYATITKAAATNGSFTVKVNGSEVSSAVKGATVTVTPTAYASYELDTITVTKTSDPSTTVTVTDGSFTMPDYPVTVTVSFRTVSTPPTVYPITEGANGQWTEGDDGSLAFRSTGPFSSFRSVTVDSKGIIKDTDYTATEGSTVITLKPKYLATLAVGEHTMRVTFTGGYSVTTFAIVESSPWVNPFTDVTENDWFYEDVAYVAEKGLMQGTGDTTFSPYLDITRGMFVTILYRLEGEPAVTGASPFDDVAAGKYYTNAVIWAASHEIVNGYGNGKFGPTDDITREQLAAILYRYAAYKGYDVTAAADLTGFSDESSISSYAVTAIGWANANGLIIGKGNGILDPGGNAKRCEVAAILHRYCEMIVK